MEDAGFGLYDTASELNEQTGITPINAPVTEGMSEKIIYSVYADIETMQFDETIDMVYKLLEIYNGFIESSSVSGVNYASRFYGWEEYRYAHFSLRVPKEQLNAMTGSLELLGNVTNLNSNADNITSQFYDTQSRLNSLKAQEERVLAMFRDAEDIPDLIAIEERLGEIRYQIESLTTILNNWQGQVDYSTLTISIREVELFTEIVQTNRTYWEQIGDGFMSTIRGVGRFFMDLFKWLIVSAPVLVILLVIAIAAFIIVRRVNRNIKKKQKNKPAKPVINPYAQGYPPPGYIPPGYTPTEPPAPPENQE